MPPPATPPQPQPPKVPSRDDVQDAKLAHIKKAMEEQEARLRKQEKELELTKKKTQALAALSAMTARVQEKMTDLRAAATLIGTAYSTAAKRHREAVAKQNQINVVKEQLMYAILGVFAGGALSWATEALKAANAAKAAQKVQRFETATTEVDAARKVLEQARQNPGTFPPSASLIALREHVEKHNLVQAKDHLSRLIEDMSRKAFNWDRFITVTSSTVSTGVGQAFQLATNYISPPSTEPVSEEPLEYQNSLVKQLDTVHLTILASLRKLADRIRDTPPEGFDKYNDADTRTAFQNWQKEANEFAGKNDLPSEATMADDLERGIWAAWMPALKTSEVRPGRCSYGGCVPTTNIEVYVPLRKPVNDRFVALGIETEEQTDWNREKEDTFLIDWAGKFLQNVQPWVKGKTKAARGQ